MNDQQLLRYSRHILLDEIGIEGQQRLLDATVLIIGLGGLGSPATLYLAASGVGKLILCDHDTVDLSNLQRQVAHQTAAIGQTKVESAARTVHAINPEVVCLTISQRAEAAELDTLIAQADVVLDCSDNFTTRYAINRACLAQRKPLVSGAAIQFSGQISVFDFRHADVPCYNCLYPEEMEAEALRCATTGVFSPLVGIIGTMQAGETLKLLMQIEQGLSSKLLTLNALTMAIRQINLKADPQCSVCSQQTSLNRQT